MRTKGDQGVENLDLQRFSQPFPIRCLLGKCKLNLERASQLKYAEVGYVFRYFDSWWLWLALHTAPQQEGDANRLCQKNHHGDWRWDTERLTNRVETNAIDAEGGSALPPAKMFHRIYRLRS